MFSKRTLIAVTVIGIAFYYGRWRQQNSADQEHLEQSVIDSWNSLISKPKTTFKRIAVGCVIFCHCLKYGGELHYASDRKGSVAKHYATVH